jgi:hypothetical protein
MNQQRNQEAVGRCPRGLDGNAARGFASLLLAATMACGGVSANPADGRGQAAGSGGGAGRVDGAADVVVDGAGSDAIAGGDAAGRVGGAGTGGASDGGAGTGGANDGGAGTGGLQDAGVPGDFLVDTDEDLVDDDVADGRCRTAARTCSLRAAIMQANHPSVAATTIRLPAGLYVLTRAPGGDVAEASGDLNVALPLLQGQTLSIVGAGGGSTIIDGNHADRVLTIAEKAVVTASGLTIRNGETAQGGGGILNNGTLTIVDCVIESNRARNGGGVDNAGTFIALDSTLRSNDAQMQGGGLHNAVPYQGAPVNPKATLHRCTLSNNHAHDGGGLWATASAFAVNSTFTKNVAAGMGGGLWVWASAGQVVGVYNTTVVDNGAAGAAADSNIPNGGGAFVQGGGRLVIANVIMARNTRTQKGTADDCAGAMESYGMNLVGTSDGCVFKTPASWSRITPATIGPAQDNGGGTATHAITANSEAVDSTIDALGCVDETGARLTVDQRGAARPAGPRCDVGAVEFGVVAPARSGGAL